ncbi:hypothetical protein LJR034_002636 [Caballeronia sp. LjRoot34]|uniref:Bbp16 family capsid cement protein n=1 Tax=Caballeronia sp. LjRoot34 TaxID=3342325 RepID=UPI003ED0AA6A
MILDQQSMFCDNQAVTVTAVSQNVLDMFPIITPNSKAQQGAGQDATLFVRAASAFTGAGASLVITLESGDNADLTGNNTVHYTTAAIPVASLVAGARLIATRLPFGYFRRYIGLRFTVAGGPFTAGTVSGFLLEDLQTVNGTTDYASNFSAL